MSVRPGGWLADCLDRLTDWLADRLADCLDRLTDWLADRLAGCLDRLTDRLAGRPTGCNLSKEIHVAHYRV